jgi:hypothetical protein
MKKPKTLFDQAIEIIEAGGKINEFLLIKNHDKDEVKFFKAAMFASGIYEAMYLAILDGNIENINIENIKIENIKIFTYTRLLLARELWNDGQEKYWKQGLFK